MDSVLNIDNKIKINRKGIEPSTILFFLMFVDLALTSFVSQQILSFFFLACVALLFLFTNKGFLSLPFAIFYCEELGLLFGISVYRYVSLLFLVFFFIRNVYIKIQYKLIPILIVYFIYCFAEVSNYGIKSTIFTFLDVVCVFILVTQYLSKKENLFSFFKMYFGVALVAFFTGLFLDKKVDLTIYQGYEHLNIERFMATFEDPNYMGFFYTIAIFALVCLKLFKPAIRIFLLIVFYSFVLSTASITAVIVNIFLWFIYFLLTKKMSFKFILSIIYILILTVALYFIGLKDRNIPILGQLSFRIQEKLTSVFNLNLNDATTGRLNLTMEHWNYFINQSFLKKLFGFNSANTKYVNLIGIDAGVAHNEYVDMLLNVGIVGTILLLGTFIIKYVNNINNYKKTKNSISLFFVMTSSIWLLYACTLTVFLDYRFFIFFLL